MTVAPHRAADRTPATYTIADLRRRMAIERPDEGREYGDHLLNADLVQLMERDNAREAAVLVAIVDRSEPTILLTRRTAALRKHSGQIAFPGGSVDPGDADAEAAALREAHEEVALDPAAAAVLGRLPRYLTTSGFRITPVVAAVRADATFRANPDEVADIFEVPLAFLMSPANHARESRRVGGFDRHYYVMPYGERFIWGVTAGILRTMYERLYA